MITGAVRFATEAIVSVAIRSGTRALTIPEAIIDTGFDGYLSLPSKTIRSLGLIPFAAVTAEVADGRHSRTRLFEGQVEWDGQLVDVEIAELRCEPMIGMRLLRDQRLTIDVRDGGRVEIRRLDA